MKWINYLLFTFLLPVIEVKGQTINGSFDNIYKRYKKNEVFTEKPTKKWNAIAWKGERIQNQLLIWSKTEIQGLSYSISDLIVGDNKIASSNVKLRFPTYVKGDPEARSCEGYANRTDYIEIADALSDVKQTTLSAKDPIKVWITIDIPTSAKEGNYLGTFTINGASNPLVFNIYIKVVDYVLPDVEDWSFHLDIWQFPVNILKRYNEANLSNKINIWTDRHFSLLEPIYRLLANAGQKSITTYIKNHALGAPSMIKWTKKDDNTWEYDFSIFEKYVTKLMSWGITKQINCFSPVGWNKTKIPYYDEASKSEKELIAHIGTEIYTLRWNHFLSAFQQFLITKNWFNKVVIYLDEPKENINEVIEMIYGNNPEWKMGITYTKNLSNDLKSKFYELSGIIDIKTNEGISNNQISTFYTSCTQKHPNNYVTLDNNPAEMTWMAWYAFNEGYSGYLRWAFDYWQNDEPFDVRDGSHTAGDFSMIYRESNNTPVKVLSSIRFEMLREGIKDYEKLNTLKKTLEKSKKPYDKQVLKKLNTMVSKFIKTSAIHAKSIVSQAKKTLDEIVLEKVTYCKVNNNDDSRYFVTRLTSNNKLGNENISFTSNQFPPFGYIYHTETKVSAFPETTINLNIENSRKSNCAKTKIWIDWNEDLDFEDENEQVYYGGTESSCKNSISHNIPITIPSNAVQGTKRIRIQVKKSSEGIPLACGNNNRSSTIDFDLVVLSNYCNVTGNEDYEATTIVTKGGNNNILFFGSNTNSNIENYMFSNEKLTIQKSKSFRISVTNSNGWSRSIVWIDWNGDNDFDDVGERLKPLSPENHTNNDIKSYTIAIKIPDTSTIGNTKLRILTGDAYTYNNSALSNIKPCGNLINASIKDFNVEILPSEI